MRYILLLLSILIGCATSGSIKKYGADTNFSSNFDVFKLYKVAVLPASSNAPACDKKILSSLTDYISLELLGINGFSLIERQAIDKILDEQAFGLTGAIDPSTAANVGKLLGAEAVLLTDVNHLKKDEFFEDEDAYEGIVFVRLVDTSTGEILFYSKGVGKSLNGKLETLEMAIKNALKTLKEKRTMK